MIIYDYWFFFVFEQCNQFLCVIYFRYLKMTDKLKDLKIKTGVAKR